MEVDSMNRLQGLVLISILFILTVKTLPSGQGQSSEADPPEQ